MAPNKKEEGAKKNKKRLKKRLLQDEGNSQLDELNNSNVSSQNSQKTCSKPKTSGQNTLKKDKVDVVQHNKKGKKIGVKDREPEGAELKCKLPDSGVSKSELDLGKIRVDEQDYLDLLSSIHKADFTSSEAHIALLKQFDRVNESEISKLVHLDHFSGLDSVSEVDKFSEFGEDLNGVLSLKKRCILGDKLGEDFGNICEFLKDKKHEDYDASESLQRLLSQRDLASELNFDQLTDSSTSTDSTPDSLDCDDNNIDVDEAVSSVDNTGVAIEPCDTPKRVKETINIEDLKAFNSKLYSHNSINSVNLVDSKHTQLGDKVQPSSNSPNSVHQVDTVDLVNTVKQGNLVDSVDTVKQSDLGDKVELGSHCESSDKVNLVKSSVNSVNVVDQGDSVQPSELVNEVDLADKVDKVNAIQPNSNTMDFGVSVKNSVDSVKQGGLSELRDKGDIVESSVKNTVNVVEYSVLDSEVDTPKKVKERISMEDLKAFNSKLSSIHTLTSIDTPKQVRKRNNSSFSHIKDRDVITINSTPTLSCFETPTAPSLTLDLGLCGSIEGLCPASSGKRSVGRRTDCVRLDGAGMGLEGGFGLRFEWGSTEMRRQWGFERLSFGLGCLVCPTRQELEMCRQLSSMGDESALSQYESGVYQSCLLRSRAFESIWGKFWGKVVSLVRRCVVRGAGKLLPILQSRSLAEPFLKVVMLDVGSDRQDQQLFLSVLQDELRALVNRKYVFLHITSVGGMDEVIRQLYIQVYSAILSSQEVPVDAQNVSSDENLLEKVGALYRNWCKKVTSSQVSESEFVVIIDKLGESINDVLYLFQMVKRRKLLPINAVVLVSTNGQYLENYCTSQIYNNLGVFECGVVVVSALVEEILQILLFDVYTQDFVPNFQMLHDIYSQFYNLDSSLSLFILRVYQMYEVYYNHYIFSYLSFVPNEFFTSNPLLTTNSLNTSNPVLTTNSIFTSNSVNSVNPVNPVNSVNSVNPVNLVDNREDVGDEILLPMESFVKGGVNDISEVSTTTSYRSFSFATPRNRRGNFEVEKIKNLYSLYSLLCISNNMNENYVAYLELKLGLDLTLEKIVMEYLPLNTVILLQNRVKFQLGIHLVYRLLSYLPDAYTINKKLIYLITTFASHSKGGGNQSALKVKELVKRIIKYINLKCKPVPHSNSEAERTIAVNKMNEFKCILTNFNNYYLRFIPIVIQIEMFLNPCEKGERRERSLKLKYDRIINIDNPLEDILHELKHKLYLLLIPSINSHPLSNLFTLQRYHNIISKTDLIYPPKQVQQDPSKFNNGIDVILFIYNNVKYKIINLWKLFIIYYYIVTSTEDLGDDLVQIYVKFNLNIEVLEKIYKVIVINCSNSSERAEPGNTVKTEIDENLHGAGDLEICKLIKNSLVNTSIKFL